MTLLAGFTRRRVEVGEVALQAAVAGDGPPVVLLHGFPQTHVAWHAVAPRLAERFTVVCPDLRGYGGSGKPPGDPGHERYAKRTMAADVRVLMAAVGHDRFIGADPELVLTHTLEAWCGTPGAIVPEALDAYREAFADPATIHAACEDYRAGSVDGQAVACGHFLAEERPGDVAAALQRFLSWLRFVGEVAASVSAGSSYSSWRLHHVYGGVCG